MAQTSLIPVAVAMARFVQEWGMDAWGREYPYWYLGVPFKYLMGPVVPVVLVGINKIAGLAYFDIAIGLIIVSVWLGSVGWGVLAGAMAKNRSLGMGVTAVLLLLPWRYVAGLALGETSVEVAKLFVPWILWLVWKRKRWAAGATTAAMLLVNTAAVTLVVTGLVLIAVGKGLKAQELEEDEEGLEGLVRQVWYNLTPVAAMMGIVTLWYGPNYWWRLVVNPWLGGASGAGTVVRIWEFVRNWLPVILGLGALRFIRGKNQSLRVFTKGWLAVFGLLTLFRLTADVDFWQDWTAWIGEMEVGVGILAGSSWVLGRTRSLSVAGVVVLIVATVGMWWALGEPKLVLREMPAGVVSLRKLADLAGNQTVFLSGSTVWWANALYDLRQVRGGTDRVAVSQEWNRAAWEIREGSDPAKLLKSLKLLNVEYVLVHTGESRQYYKDFKNLGKWDLVGRKAWEENGDVIYEIK